MLTLIRARLVRLTPTTISIVAAASPPQQRLRPPSPSSFSSSSSTSPDDRSQTIQFLENSCGLPPKVATVVAKRFHIKTTAKAEAVLAILDEYGFSKPQIAKIVARRPQVLSSNPSKTLKPKLDFFRGLKVSNDDALEIISSLPVMLSSSLTTLESCVEHLMSVLQDERKVLLAIKRLAGMIRVNLPAVLLPRLQQLRSLGVPNSVICMLLTTAPSGLIKTKRPFEEVLDMIKKTGIDSSKSMFAHAFRVLIEFPKPNWERKLDVYKSLGWSEEQILCAFGKYPYLMASSEERIRRNLKFFSETLKWGPEELCRNPIVLSFSIDGRTMPRISVLKALASNDLLKCRITARHLKMVNKAFLDKYVIKYQNKVPEVADFMMGKA